MFPGELVVLGGVLVAEVAELGEGFEEFSRAELNPLDATTDSPVVQSRGTEQR